MTLFFTIIIFLYAMTMAISALLTYRELPIITLLINLLGSLCLLFSYQNIAMLFGGLSWLLVAALLNGLALNQKVNWRHFTIRLLFSITLLFLLI